MAKLEKTRQGLENKLNNPSFVEKAPAEVVDKDRQRLVETEESLARHAEQRQRLQNMRP